MSSNNINDKTTIEDGPAVPTTIVASIDDDHPTFEKDNRCPPQAAAADGDDDDEQVTLRRLYDSLDAMQEMNLLSSEVGVFVIRSSLARAKKRSRQDTTDELAASMKKQKLAASSSSSAEYGTDSEAKSSFTVDGRGRVHKLAKLFLIMHRAQKRFAKEIEQAILQEEQQEDDDESSNVTPALLVDPEHHHQESSSLPTLEATT